MLSSLRYRQALSIEALGEGLRIFRLGKTEHHEVAVVATEVIWPRSNRQNIRKAAHGLIVHNATHLVSGERDVVRPLAQTLGRPRGVGPGVAEVVKQNQAGQGATMAFREGLKEWWNDPEKFWSRRYPRLYRGLGPFRRSTIRDWLWVLVGTGLVGAVRDYNLGHSLGLIILDLTVTLAGLIGRAIIWWKDRRTKQ